MRELRERQQFKSFLYSLPALVLLVIVTFLLARGAAAIMSKKHESAERLEELEERNATLRERHESLEGSIAKLQTEEGIIEVIRAKFNAARAGEHLAVIVEEEVKATTTESGVAAQLKKGWSWLKSLWGSH